MGLQAGVDSPKFQTHKKFYTNMERKSDVMLIENVPEYGTEIAASHLGREWELDSAVVDPRVFGLPASRPRLYILAFRKKTVRRRGDVWFGCSSAGCDSLFTSKVFKHMSWLRTLAAVIEILTSKTVATADMFVWEKVPRSILTPAQVPRYNKK